MLRFKTIQGRLNTTVCFILGKNILMHVIVCLFLAGVILASYISALDNPLVFDSRYMLPEESLKLWTPGFSIKTFLAGHRYLVSQTFGLNYYFFGMSPFWFRIVNVVLHVCNTLLVYLFLTRLSKTVLMERKDSARFKGTGHLIQIAAGLAAFLFGLNTAALYGVVYVIQRFVLAASFFSLLGMMAYLEGLIRYKEFQKGQWWLFYLAVVCYFFAVRCKEQAVTLPAVLFALTFLVVSVDRRLVLKLVGPFILFAVIGVHITLSMRGIVGNVYEPFAKYAVSPANQQFFFGAAWDPGQAHLQSIFNQATMFFKYLYLWLIPDVTRMSLDLSQPFLIGYLRWPGTLFCVLFCLYPVTAVWLLFKRGFVGLLGFGLLFPFVMFATELSTVRFHENFVLYRSYLWMLCFFSTLPFFISRLPGKKMAGTLFGAVLLCYCIIQMAALQHRLIPFKTELALWEDAVKKLDIENKSIPAAYRTVGNYAAELGSVKRTAEAFKYYQMAAQLNPHYDKAWYGMAGSLMFENKFNEAIPYLDRAIAENPLLQQAYYWRGACYMQLGRWAEAVKNLELAAIGFESEYLDSRYKLAKALTGLGDKNRALAVYDDVLNRDPAHATALYEKALLLLTLGKKDEAVEYFKAALKIKPDFIESRRALEVLLRR
ncbi:MAG: tetratricopeptide repeat protein [Deltaproteobacteria bacterium]|nr:tetratricopeptide repeat protein [Deltaproteobacteria bacterium]